MPHEAIAVDRETLLQQCKTILKQHYRSRFKGLILYGSVVRGHSDAESDLDLLVLLSPPVDYFQELRTIIELLYPLQLQSEQLISAKPVAWNEFVRGSKEFLRDAKREGMAV